MRNREEIEDDILNLKIEKALVVTLEKDGEKQESELSKYNKYKSNDNKAIIKLRRKEKLKSYTRTAGKMIPRVCAVILALIVVSCSFLFTNEKAMASVITILAEKYDIHIEVKLPDTPQVVENFHYDGYNYPTYLPEGFEIQRMEVSAKTMYITSYNQEEDSILIEQSVLEMNLNLDSETVCEESFYLNEKEFYYYGNYDKNINGIVGNYNGINIHIRSKNVDKDELIYIINGLVINK